MLKLQTFMRKEVADVNNIDTLKVKERIFYGIKWGIEHSENAIYKSLKKQEKEFSINSKAIERLTALLLKEINDNFIGRSDLSKFCILINKKYENVLPKVKKKKEFLGYTIKLGEVNELALKTVKNVRIPLIISREVIL